MEKESVVAHQNDCYRQSESDRLDDNVTSLCNFATCGCRCFLREQLRKTRVRVLGNDVGKGLHFNVLVVELFAEKTTASTRALMAGLPASAPSAVLTVRQPKELSGKPEPGVTIALAKAAMPSRSRFSKWPSSALAIRLV